eukprot:Rmarinus@m.14656
MASSTISKGIRFRYDNETVGLSLDEPTVKRLHCLHLRRDPDPIPLRLLGRRHGVRRVLQVCQRACGIVGFRSCAVRRGAVVSRTRKTEGLSCKEKCLKQKENSGEKKCAKRICNTRY